MTIDTEKEILKFMLMMKCGYVCDILPKEDSLMLYQLMEALANTDDKNIMESDTYDA